jgi:hypothetical protein
MAPQHLHDLTEVRQGLRLTTGEGIGQVSEEPRPAEAATSDHHPVCTGLADHAECVSGLPDVAIAQDWDIDVLLQLADRVPVGLPGVRLLCGPAVQCNGGAAGFLGDPAGIQEGLMIMVDAMVTGTP